MNASDQPIPQLWREEIVLLKNAVAGMPEHSNIVEIGTAQGGGFHLIASSRRDPARIRLHSFDPCPGNAVSHLTKLHKNAFSHKLFSTEGAAAWNTRENGAVNMLIIDGSHTLVSVFEDYTSWKQHLARPSEIIFHDYDSPVRDGASHPGVKVVCDALLANKGDGISVKERQGRYLHLALQSPPSITLTNLKRAFTNWIARAIKIAQSYATGDRKFALIRHYRRHSRLCTRSAAMARATGRDSDLAFTLHAASSAGMSHEILLDRSDDRAGVLKWLEYLEMFLHARNWPPGSLLTSRANPVLNQCKDCTDIESLSQLCADMAVLVGLSERIFNFVSK